MVNAFLFGALAQSTLILGGLIVYWFRSMAKVVLMWLGVVVICGVTAAVVWVMTKYVPLTGDRASAFAAGGLVAMLMDSLIPFGVERGGLMTGFFGALGFAVSVLQQ